MRILTINLYFHN